MLRHWLGKGKGKSMLTLLSLGERKNKVCAVCGTQKSVKYSVDVTNEISNKKFKATVCNMCALKLCGGVVPGVRVNGTV